MFFSIYLCAVYVRLLNSNAQLDSDLKRERRRRKGFVYQQRIIRTDYLLLLLHLANSSSPGRGERKKENKRRNESDGVVRVSSVLRATIFLQFVWCSRRVFLLSNLLGLCVCVCSSSELGSPGSHKPLAPPPCLPVFFVCGPTHTQTDTRQGAADDREWPPRADLRPAAAVAAAESAACRAAARATMAVPKWWWVFWPRPVAERPTRSSTFAPVSWLNRFPSSGSKSDTTAFRSQCNVASSFGRFRATNATFACIPPSPGRRPTLWNIKICHFIED